MRVNRPVADSAVENVLPEGWGLRDIDLDTGWQAELVGEVHVLRLDDGTSFQGPIGAMPASEGFQ